MPVRLLTPTEQCCTPALLAIRTGQTATCARGHDWITVDAIDEGRGNHDWYAKWVIA
jgi:hypothetical protein